MAADAQTPEWLDEYLAHVDVFNSSLTPPSSPVGFESPHSDAYDPDCHHSPDEHHHGHHADEPITSPQHTYSAHQRRTQTKAARARATTRQPRKLPRAEILRLRAEILVLTARLAQLQATKSRDQTARPLSSQADDLQWSKALNNALKCEVAEHILLQRSLETLLHDLTVSNVRA